MNEQSEEKGEEQSSTKKTPPLTEYIVLVREGQKGAGYAEGDVPWGIAGRQNARSSAAAIRATAEELGAGIYVACPSRSWQPVTVEVETKKQLKFA